VKSKKRTKGKEREKEIEWTMSERKECEERKEKKRRMVWYSMGCRDRSSVW
jgi:hypothetical protein